MQEPRSGWRPFFILLKVRKRILLVFSDLILGGSGFNMVEYAGTLPLIEAHHELD